MLETILSGRLPQTVLLTGEADKMPLARALAAALLCTQRQDGQPACGSCHACRKAAQDIHPDLTILDEQDNDIKVDTIRALRAAICVLPNDGARRVMIICHAERMNTAAQNALLKTLEEPPAYAFFILTAQKPEALLPTILSRVTRYNLAPEEQNIPEESALQAIHPIVSALAQAKEMQLLSAAMGLEKLPRNAQKDALLLLRTAIRDAIFAAEHIASPLLPQLRADTERLANRVSIPRLLRLSEFCSKLAGRLEVNASAAATSAALSAGAFTICYSKEKEI